MSEAVQLFIDRAVRVRPNFRVSNSNAPAVAQICQRLSGMPLAIELAAARTRVLSPEQIARGLDDRFRLLTGGAGILVPRQQTLLASIDWSHDLLSEPERMLFRRLAVFPSTFDLDAAEAICARESLAREVVLDVLSSLVDKSLVQLDGEGAVARYRLLESIRQYARDRLTESEEEDEVADRHTGYYVDLFVDAAERLDEENSTTWLEPGRTEYDNVRAAHDRAVLRDDWRSVFRLISSLGWFWLTSGLFVEGRVWSEQALEHEAESTAGRMAVLTTLCWLLSIGMNEPERARTVGTEALEISRTLGANAWRRRVLAALLNLVRSVDDLEYVRGLVDELAQVAEPGDLAARSARVSATLWVVGDAAEASRVLLEEIAATETADEVTASWLMSSLGIVWIEAGRLADAEEILRRAMDLAIKHGHWSTEIAMGNLVLSLMQQGRYDEAHRGLDELCAVRPALFAEWAPLSRGRLAYVAGDVPTACRELDAAYEIRRESGGALFWWIAPWTAQAYITAGDVDRASRVLETVPRAPAFIRPLPLLARCRLVYAMGNRRETETLLHELFVLCAEQSLVPAAVDGLELLAQVAIGDGGGPAAARVLGAADALRERIGYARYPIYTATYEECITALRTSMGERALATALAEGAAMSLGDIVAYATRGRGPRDRPTSGWASLTPTELSVADLVAQGLSNPEIAARLFVSRRTVTTHLTHIFAKLGITSRTELASVAIRRGL
jgi:DNA-binding CsgD family transcriptional regulator/tetratricopeptide (TPR) repeat protein